MTSFVDSMESVAKRVGVNNINIGLKYAGLKCKLFKRLSTPQDSVYGVYGDGSASPISLNSQSVYGAYDTLTSTEESSYDISQTPIDVVVLITAYQWRAIGTMNGGYYDDPGEMYASSDVEISHGDVLAVTRTDGTALRFKVTYPTTIGRVENILTRFKISNIGD